MQFSLEMAVKQQLSISPQLQQAIKLLQLSSMEMLEEIKQIAERNPMLEIDQPEKTSQEHERYTASHSIQRMHFENDLIDSLANAIETENLSTFLLQQLQLTHLSVNQEIIATSIIDALNNDGYLTISIAEIQKTLQNQKITASHSEIENVLMIIQSLDPVGVGAKNVQECILLQLKKKDLSDTTIQNAMAIMTDYFEAYTKKDYKKICQKTGWSLDTLISASRAIKSVNPRPAASHTNLSNHFIVPDVFVQKTNGLWTVHLNPSINFMPRINETYLALASPSNTEEEKKYFKENVKEAKWLINSIKNRHETLFKVTKAIMEYQSGFLEYGITHMLPLTLSTIAEQVNLHESTISRITTQKFIFTSHGTFELKHFFSSQITSDSGHSNSSTAIKAQIKNMIDSESKEKPLSDNAIMALLNENGISIARRTVTKYREAMSIESSTERKWLSA